ELRVTVVRNLVPSTADAGLHCFQAHPSNLSDERNPAKPVSLFCFALQSRFRPGRFHSFAIGWRSHDVFPPVFVVVRASAVSDSRGVGSQTLSHRASARELYLLFV